MTWQEDEATVTRHRMMQFADECIETKTVTTTTTTKRSYPPLFLREPRDVHTLDSKEYPLATKPTPPELRKLTFDLDEYETESWEEEDKTDTQVSSVTVGQHRYPRALMQLHPDSTVRKHRVDWPHQT